MKEAIRLKPEETCLLLVDLQEEQRSDPLYAVDAFADVLANAAKLLAAARRRHLQIAHAAYERDLCAVPPRPFEPLNADGRPLFSDKDDPRSALCREVAPLAGETLVSKNDASAFHATGLADLLESRNIAWLIVSGVWSEACVAATVRDAIAHGFRVLLVKDACGSGSKAMHQTAILNLANRLYGGAVCDTGTAIRLISGEEANVWRTDRPVPMRFEFHNLSAFYDAL